MKIFIINLKIEFIFIAKLMFGIINRNDYFLKLNKAKKNYTLSNNNKGINSS